MLVYTQAADCSNNDGIIDLREFGLGIIEIKVLHVKGDKARIGYEGDRAIPIHRREVFERIESENQREQGEQE